MKRANCIIITVWLLSVIQPFAIAQEEVEFVIPMSRGWNMISSPVIPAERDFRVMFEQIERRGNLIILKDVFGCFWMPDWDWDWELDPWDFRQAYQVKLAGDDTLTVTGEPVDPGLIIQLRRGWSMIAYFPDEQLDAVTAFANIEELLIIAKDEFGNFYAPEYNFNNMEELRQGRGYCVKVSEAVEFVWNTEE